MVQALLTSKITYSTPYLNLRPQETAKIESLKAYKTALGLIIYTSTDELLDPRLHNVFGELMGAQRNSQLPRLTFTSTGHAVVHTLGYPMTPNQERPQRLPTAIKHRIHVSTIPRLMHPTFNKGHLEARVSCFMKLAVPSRSVTLTSSVTPALEAKIRSPSILRGRHHGRQQNTDGRSSGNRLCSHHPRQASPHHCSLLLTAGMPPLPRRSSPTPGHSTRPDHHHDYLDSRARWPSGNEAALAPA